MAICVTPSTNLMPMALWPALDLTMAQVSPVFKAEIRRA
jgi:hypothetical protein